MSEKTFDEYLLEQIKDNPELAAAYAKASCETKDYVKIIESQRQVIKELVEDAEFWYGEHQGRPSDEDIEIHRSLMAKIKEMLG